MSSIAGFFEPNTIYSKENEFCIKTIHDMSDALIHRGPDEQSYFYFPHGALNHNFLLAGYIPGPFPRAIQPTTRTYHDNSYTILFDGFISNIDFIAQWLENHDVHTTGMSVEEILLSAFFKLGTDFVKMLRGAFAMALYDENHRTLYLFRDALGLRPLFYCQKGHTLVFASEIKSIFKYPTIHPILEKAGLIELLSLGPARKPGSAIFSGISEVKPGHFITFGRDIFLEERYHHFTVKEHHDSFEDTMEHITELLNNSIHSLSTSVLPSASLLSGGLDSSIITAKLTEYYDIPLPTYSLDFDNSKQFFKANAFQPSLDAPYVQEMSNYLGTQHTIYTCNNEIQADYLKESVAAHDLPAMADVDSSYMYFCKRVGEKHKIVFTGECADEIFCGYPWYHNVTSDPKTFPWSMDLNARTVLLNTELINANNLSTCIHDAYQETCYEIDIDGQNTPASLVHRKTFYLTLRYFMQTLINRGDRAAAAHRMDARMPFAYQELVEYLFNIPFEMQAHNNQRKYLLREYAKGLLPEDVRLRKKSPYPKTYDPGYESLVSQKLLTALQQKDCPLLAFVDKDKVTNFCLQTKDLSRPWYGQLMAGPQLLAHYLQILYWIEMYNIEIKI